MSVASWPCRATSATSTDTQVGRLLDKLDAVLAGDGSYKIKNFRRAGS